MYIDSKANVPCISLADVKYCFVVGPVFPVWILTVVGVKTNAQHFKTRKEGK